MWCCAATDLKLGDEGAAASSDALGLAWKALVTWYASSVGAEILQVPTSLLLREWFDAILAQHVWNSRFCVVVVLAAALFMAEFSLLEAETDNIPDVKPLVDAIRLFTWYFALYDSSSMGTAGWNCGHLQLLGGEMRFMEASARYMRHIKRLTGQSTGDNCGCFHQGWDYFIGLHSQMTKTLGNPKLPEKVANVASFERSVVLGQNCEGEGWVSWNLEVSEALRRVAIGTFCVQGEIALLLLCASKAIVQDNIRVALRNMEYAAAFAILIVDCLPSHQWSFGARDVFFNAGHLLNYAKGVRETIGVRQAVWRIRHSSIQALPPQWLPRLRSLGYSDGRAARQKCSTELKEVCVEPGSLLRVHQVAPDIAEYSEFQHKGFRQIHLPICNDYGVRWVSALQVFEHKQHASKFPKDTRIAIFLPTASLYNPEHAFHWLLPALDYMYGELSGQHNPKLNPANVDLVIYPDTRGTVGDEAVEKSWMKQFFGLFSDNPPVFYDKVAAPMCWRKMIWNPQTVFNLRRSNFNRVDPLIFIRTETIIRRHPAFMPGPGPNGTKLYWRCASVCEHAQKPDETQWWILHAATANINCGNCLCCKVRRDVGVPASDTRLNILLVQRSHGIGRSIINLEEITQMLSKFGSFANLKIMHPSNDGTFADHGGEWNPVRQVLMMHRFDMVLGSYGAALAFSAFMNSGVVIEFFPSLPHSASTLCVDGWGVNNYTVYGGLAEQSNQRHTCIIGVQDVEETEAWRDLPIHLEVSRLETLVTQGLEWLMWDRFKIKLKRPI